MKSILKLLFFVLIFSTCSNEEDIIVIEDPEILSFSIKEMQAEFVVNNESNTIEATLQQDLDITNLTALFSLPNDSEAFIGITKQVSGVTKNDFSKPVRYIVENVEGKKITYTVIINPYPKIISFKIAELDGIDFIVNDLDITANVPSGTDLTDLTAVFQITPGASLTVNSNTQISNQTKNDFTNPLTYILNGSDGSAKNYTVNITENPNNLPEADAGANQLYFIPINSNVAQVILDGSNSSDQESDLVSYSWKLNGTVIGDSKISTVNLGIGVYTIELTVTDTTGDTDTDTTIIDVRQAGTYLPIDSDASFETKNLFEKLGAIGDSDEFIFGQEFPMSFKLNGLRTDLSTSDCKDVTGDHPGVFGIDPNYMIYKSDEQKQLHIQEAQFAYQNGGIVTFDFHQESKTDGRFYYDEISTETDKSLMYDIVNDLNGSREWFYDELDQVIDIINNDLGFPVIFRLFHEMDGDWFWWGSRATNHSPQLYVDFYRLAVNYIKDKSNLVLFGWSPNQRVRLEYYPGNDYVDIIGVDVYNSSKSALKNRLIELTTFAKERGKVASLTETGFYNFIDNNPTFWTSTVLDAIVEGGSDIRLGWVLAWFNAPWHSSQNDLYIPNSNSSPAIKDDFINFYNSPFTMFLQETAALNVYN